jgi:hypothetical protein
MLILKIAVGNVGLMANFLREPPVGAKQGTPKE